jgi:dihydropteroate synthase
MEAALQAGARIVNDVTALSGDARALDVVAAREDTGVVLMHMRGDPRTMQANPSYADVTLDIYDYLEERIAVCEAAGIGRARIHVDPGSGFGKTLAHNLRLLEQLAVYHALGSAVLLGASRKSFIGALSRKEESAARQPGSLAAVLAGAARGVQIFRVHDVPETRQALKVWQAITEAEP